MKGSDSRDEAPRLLAERYRLGRELGRGGMATVYLAEDVRHHRQVAVKVLHAELGGGLSAERFLREIRIAAGLLHPHVLTLIDSGQADGLLFYVMPYVEGETLRKRLDRVGELPVEEGVRILREVVDALAYAHRRGIVHRDVKPENVLLTGDHALVADFGVAKALATATGSAEGDTVATSRTALTTLGVALGTPSYMAPEQAAGDPHVDHRADIYAVGVLAYEMLAGAPPFVGPTPQHVMAAHVARVPEPLARRRPSLPAALEQLVMRCLEKHPADRWQSGEEMLRRLDAVSLPAVGAPVDPGHRELVEGTFRLGEDVCRKLNRATLDPRMIGGTQRYLDNGIDSPILLCCIHGTGYDQRQFTRLLQLAPYRAIAPTLYGFEPDATRRGVLSLDDHLVVLREFVQDAVRRLRPERTLLVGFSSGADVVLRLLATHDVDRGLVDGALALGANLSLESCFVTRLLARIDADDPQGMLAVLRTLGDGADTLHDWLNIHEYLVTTLRKFGREIAPLRRFSADVAAPFEDGEDDPFTRWYRGASARVRRLRCVFEDVESLNRPLRALRLRNLDERILGESYREGSIVTEPGTDHFDLISTELVLRHVESLVGELREP